MIASIRNWFARLRYPARTKFDDFVLCSHRDVIIMADNKTRKLHEIRRDDHSGQYVFTEIGRF